MPLIGTLGSFQERFYMAGLFNPYQINKWKLDKILFSNIHRLFMDAAFGESRSWPSRECHKAYKWLRECPMVHLKARARAERAPSVPL